MYLFSICSILQCVQGFNAFISRFPPPATMDYLAFFCVYMPFIFTDVPDIAFDQFESFEKVCLASCYFRASHCVTPDFCFCEFLFCEFL